MPSMKWVLYDWGGFNTTLFYWINGFREEWWDECMQFGSELGDHTHFISYLSVMVLAAVIAVPRRMRRGRVPGEVSAKRWLLALSVFVLSYYLQGEIIGWLKPFLDFPRPASVLHGNLHLLGTSELHHSFPSGHATFAMLVSASFWIVIKGWSRVLLVVFALLVGISRISLGMHFPADVIAGYLMSFSIVLMMRFVLFWLMKTMRRT